MQFLLSSLIKPVIWEMSKFFAKNLFRTRMRFVNSNLHFFPSSIPSVNLGPIEVQMCPFRSKSTWFAFKIYLNAFCPNCICYCNSQMDRQRLCFSVISFLAPGSSLGSVFFEWNKSPEIELKTMKFHFSSALSCSSLQHWR